MIFDNLVAGDAVFLDSNVFLLHFTAHARYGVACTDLLKRIGRGELAGFTSTHVLGEVAHRLMTIEANQKYGWPFTGIVYRLQKNPAEVQGLSDFRQSLREISKSGVTTLVIAPDLLDSAANVSQQTGLLSNDALIVALMRANGLDKIASEDSDFDRVPGLARFAPV